MVYSPGTLETDPKKQNMALQQQASAIKGAAADIAAIQAAIAGPPWGTGTVTNVATSGLATGGPITTTGTVTVAAATQSDQETGTSTTAAVVPGVQKYHPAHPKAWAYITQSGGTYTLTASHGVSGINKVATGRVDITLSPAFSSTSYAAIVAPGEGGSFICTQIEANRTASNFRVLCRNVGTGLDADFGFSIIFLGDQ